MEKKLKIFKSFEEQEIYHLDEMRNTSVRERLQRLYAMQQLTQAFHPTKNSFRKLIVRKWTS